MILTLHDLNLAAAYCDEVYVMDQGRFVANGTPADVFQPDLIQAVFGVTADIETDSTLGGPRIHFNRKVRP